MKHYSILKRAIIPELFGKIIMLTFNGTREKAVKKAIAALADMIPLEAIQPPQSHTLVFPGLEISLHQRRVLCAGILPGRRIYLSGRFMGSAPADITAGKRRRQNLPMDETPPL